MSSESTDGKVRVDMPGHLLEKFDGGSALVDVDGKEILVPEKEWRYVGPDSNQ